MSNDVMEKVKLLPPEKQQEVEDFVDYLISKYKLHGKDAGESLAEQRRKIWDGQRGKVGWQMILTKHRKILKIICNAIYFVRYTRPHLACNRP